MTGLRERKKEQTRRRIAAAALRLFAERGFDAVTVNEIAEAAEVSKVTLFAYFPTKESLVLHGIGEEDLAGIVAGRPPDRSPLDALRASFRALAADPALPPTPEETEALVTRVRVIFGSPALTTAASALLHRQREALAAALSTECDELTAALMAAQISAAGMSRWRRPKENAYPMAAAETTTTSSVRPASSTAATSPCSAAMSPASEISASSKGTGH